MPQPELPRFDYACWLRKHVDHDDDHQHHDHHRCLHRGDSLGVERYHVGRYRPSILYRLHWLLFVGHGLRGFDAGLHGPIWDIPADHLRMRQHDDDNHH